MKVLSYNIYGVRETKSPIPEWNVRQENLYNNLNKILKDGEIKILCFQEVNENNIPAIKLYQKYNIIAIKDDSSIKINKVFCLPHGRDDEYKNINEQIIDYNMSDYRTTLFVDFKYDNKKYLIGCIHTDYISTEGKIKGTVKSLNYMDKVNADYKFIVGDMNMVSHMSEVYNILKQNNNYITKSRNSNFNVEDNSWQGYGMMEQVNVDFAFVEKQKENCYEYNIIKQADMMMEGSDHRPIIITVKNY